LLEAKGADVLIAEYAADAKLQYVADEYAADEYAADVTRTY